jgi:hypothetical protein
MKFSFRLFFLSGCVIAFSACGDNHVETAQQPQSVSGNSSAHPKDTSPTSSAPAQPRTEPAPDNLSFKYLAVIREFSAADRAALFGVLPTKDGMQITDVSGPGFLGDAHVGILTADNAGKFFNRSSIPMSAEEKTTLLSQYAGAQVIYFEGFSSSLCTGQVFKLTVSGLLDSKKLTTTFQFSAQPNSHGDCTFITLSETTVR